MKKRAISILLTLVMTLGLFPTAAFAAGAADWAQDAVNKLNEIYEPDLGISSSTDPMLKSQAAAVFTKMGNSAVADTLTGEGYLTRAEACDALVQAFAIPTGGKSAIEYLYEKNIISGKSSGALEEGGDVSSAEFSVLIYRVLNYTGGGEGSVESIKPGTEEHFAWMYLAVRACVPLQSTQTGVKISDAQFWVKDKQIQETEKDGFEKKYGETLWSYWIEKLGIASNAPAYNPEQTLLQAATTIVKSKNATQIFDDVTPDDWFYDGIMYLANQNFVTGYGDGNFGADDPTPRYELAVLLYTIEKGEKSSGPNALIDSIKHAVEKGYMTGTVSEEASWDPRTDPDWSAIATREEAAVGILKMIANKEKISTQNENTAILDRFAQDTITPGNETYLAYAVSMGLLSGTSENTLSPQAPVTRAQVGVLAYRTLIGLDTSKMHDYDQNVQNALGTDSASTASTTEG